MSGPPPRQVTRENEQRAWRLRQQFWTEQQIADELGVDQSTVHKMLDRVERRLAEQFESEALAIKARQTAQLEQIAAEAFSAWQKSRQDAELERVLTEEVSLVGDEEGGSITIPAVKVKTTTERKGQSGDSALMGQIRGALADIRSIWGLDAPKQSDRADSGNGATAPPTRVFIVQPGKEPQEVTTDSSESVAGGG